MKKLLSAIILIFSAIAVFASQEDKTDLFRKKAMRQYYNAIYDCKKGTFIPPENQFLGMHLRYEFQVLGQDGDNCRIQEKTITYLPEESLKDYMETFNINPTEEINSVTSRTIIKCNFPMDIAREYAESLLEDIDTNEDLDNSNDGDNTRITLDSSKAMQKRYNQLINDSTYCSTRDYTK